MNNKIWILYLSLVSFHSVVYAENLSQVYHQAQSYDSQLMSQESSYLAATEDKTLARSAKNARVTLTGSINESFTHYYQDAVSPLTLEDEFNLNAAYSVELRKTLYNRKIDRQVKQADAGVDQAYSVLQQQRQGLIMRTAQRYFDYLSAQQRLTFIRDELASVQKRMAQTEAFYKVGRAPITGLREAQSRYYQVTSKQVNALRDVEVAREALRVITGRQYSTLNAPGNIPLVMPIPESQDEWVNLALQYNKELQTAYKAVQVAQANLATKRQGNSANVDMVANHSSSLLQGEAVKDPRLSQFSFGLEAAVPFYTGGSTAAEIRQGQHQLTSAQQSYQHMRRETEEKVRSAYFTLRSSIAFARASQQSLLAAQTALDATVAGFEAGSRTAADVLDAQSNASDAQYIESKARNDFLLGLLNLRSVAGILSAEDLKVIDGMLE